jgi:pyrophosphatase PpaX
MKNAVPQSLVKGVCFDIDGTLADTLPVVYRAFQEVTEKFVGRSYSEEKIAKLFGPNEEGILQKLVPEQWEKCLPVFHQAYEKAHSSCNAPYNGIDRALLLLRNRGVRLGVVTGKGRVSTLMTLEKLSLISFLTR